MTGENLAVGIPVEMMKVNRLKEVLVKKSPVKVKNLAMEIQENLMKKHLKNQ